MRIKFWIFFFLFPIFIFGQSWRSTIDLNIQVNDAYRLDLYTNIDGNHVLTFNGNTLVYRLFSYNGNLIRSQTIATGLNEDARLAKISGYGQYLYISYKNGNKIYTKRSTNAGQSWSNLENIFMNYSQSNGIEIWDDSNGLHLVWSEYNSELDKYDTYYKRSPHTQNYWVDFKKITDNSNDHGGFPSVTTSSNRVHVAYTQGTSSLPSYNRGITETRDKYNSTWQNPIQGFNDAMCSKIIATSSKLHLFYYDFVPGMGLWYGSLYYKNKDFGASSWPSTGTQIYYYSDPNDHMIDAAVTENDMLHILYDNDNNDLVYRNWHNGVWSSPVSLAHAYAWYSQQISSDGNDLYVIWNDSDDETIYLKQCDYPPMAPELSLDASGDHPVLSWNKPNADVKEYKIYRKSGAYGNFYHIATTSNLTWTDVSIDLDMPDTQYWYKIKAVDYYNNESDFSNTESVWGIHKVAAKDPDGSNNGLPEKFQLYQNSPNPFNPTTNIVFDLPVTSKVKLIVFDINGKVVQTIFNGVLEAGRHQFKFNASNLPSGVYMYQIKARNYVAVKKMIFTK